MIDPNRTRRVDVRLCQALETRTLPKELLIEGPAGTGKTFGILAFFHTLAMQVPSFRVLVTRQTRASLTESVLAAYEDHVLPAFGHERVCFGQHRRHRMSYDFPLTGARIVLGGLDKPDRFLSSDWDAIWVNEAIETVEHAWEMLRGRLSRPGRDPRFGFLLGDTNPGDPSHFLNQRCEAGRTIRWQTTHAANPALFDHNGWTAAWAPFKANLKSLTGSRLKRFFLGIWAAGEGAWFSQFDPDSAVTPAAEFDRRHPVHLAVDTGVHTGAVLYQIKPEPTGELINVFADYYSYDVSAESNARAILEMVRKHCSGFDVGRMDPAGGTRSGFGAMTIQSEFERCGLRLQSWLKYPGCVLAGLNLLSAFIDVPGKFLVHPRCQSTINALANYKRAKRGSQYVDEPEDPQHPHEELVDALRSSLLDKFPEGRRPEPKLARVAASRVF